MATNGTLLIRGGQTSGIIKIPVNGVSTISGAKNFFVNLTSATNATLPAGTKGTATIVNSNGSEITVGDVTVVEGNNGTSTVSFPIYLSATVPQPVSVSYFTTNGTALTGIDFLGVPQMNPLTLTIPAGGTTGTITIPIIGNTTRQANRTFFLNLLNPVNAGMAQPRLGRGHQPARNAGAMVAGKLAYRIIARGVPGQRGRARRQIVGAG